MRINTWMIGLGCGAALAAAGCAESQEDDGPSSRPERLAAADTWMYQLAGLDDAQPLDALADSPYPMLVVEPGHNFRPCEGFDPASVGVPRANAEDACADPWDTEGVVDALRTTPDGQERLLIAYIDVGQAEWYRDYWEEGWAPPTADAPGSPTYILEADPDGWTGNFVVAYWRAEWKALWLGDGDQPGIVAELAEMGFDGVYLDWVEAYDSDRVQSAADADGVNAAEEMVTFVEEIGEAGREVTFDFVVVAQNATFLLDDVDDPARYAAAIDALAVEDTWYYGNGSTEDWDAGDGDRGPWDISDRLDCEAESCTEAIEAPDNVCPDETEARVCLEDFPVSGDLHGGARHTCEAGQEGTSGCWSTDNRLEAYARYRARGVPVFTVDYCISEATTAEAYRESRRHGLKPLVTRVQLSRLSDTPPWDYE